MKWQNSVLTANLVKHCASGRKATNTETEHKETDNESGTLSQQEYLFEIISNDKNMADNVNDHRVFAFQSGQGENMR